MCTPLAKLAIGLSATMATGFYYLAAAPPASAVDVCGPGNYSSACVPDNTPSPGAASLSPDPEPASAALRESVLDSPAVEAAPVIADPVPTPVVVEAAPVIADPEPAPVVVEAAPVIADPVPTPVVVEAAPVIADPVPTPVVQSPVIADPVPAPVAQPAAAPTFTNIYTNAPAVRSTPIPEPGTAIALVLTGAGMIFCGIKRNKQVGQQR